MTLTPTSTTTFVVNGQEVAVRADQGDVHLRSAVDEVSGRQFLDRVFLQRIQVSDAGQLDGQIDGQIVLDVELLDLDHRRISVSAHIDIPRRA